MAQKINSIRVIILVIVILLLAAAAFLYIYKKNNIIIYDAATACRMDNSSVNWGSSAMVGLLSSCNKNENSLFSEKEGKCIHCPAETKTVCVDGVVTCQEKKGLFW